AIEDNTPGGVNNGNSIAIDDGSCTNTNWARMLTFPIFGRDDNRTNYGCLPSDTTHVGDILVIRYAAPWVIGGITTPNFDNDQFYIRSSLFEGTMFRGQDEATNPVTGAAVRTAELVSNGYFIHTSTNSDPNKCTGSAAIPSLYRIGLRSGALVSEEIAYGVDQFQVQFGLDTNGDDSVDSYVDAPDATDTTSWDQVIAARIWILVRAECPETGYTNSNTYSIGNIDHTPDDGYRRQLFTSTISMRN
ncbi:MAG: PilW family protein, partial [Gammaproteobacteria bacterium]|nr:PilW family protein [Gammaproteobacteria bacterium]